MPYLGLIITLLWLGCLVDVICSDEERVRHLPKLLWLMIVLLLPLAGSVLWLVLGRPQGVVEILMSKSAAEYPRPTRPVVDPEHDDDFQRRFRARVEEQRRVAQEQRQREEGNENAG
ncbi:MULTISPECIES: PLDc N-terminal domain-containing protein [Rhodococcus]|uniref:PLDc N-terminal domain-containing protein n=1 Tax=Rhodococcus artemisiae TaxID=714159 RepID=A0ABU7L753_9NOCA|nr:MULTISPECIES: PLDc N-terminal domain-containing protein [Rhodococcus]MEE2057149.1 PLDc N-terminal domain-containing protein [Rhodococcus artemisiae]TCN50746.1 phospholipase D-like protein [Rhodococcus sp. SMB37]